MEPTVGERACFEAGIKFGTLYHQFAGTPVRPESAASLERAMEESIENQPHASTVTVDILESALDDAIDHGYTELTGEFMEVEIVIEYEDSEVITSMAMEDGYPLMRVDDIRRGE
ncbi:dihydroneopterin aldolase family protein [Natranaeroarchaeum aerophilus]|uniref:Dihydroneopterin aldolase n=1 Tax=Natranaeroarchaeum aerophilus TaxID=2917711 RepID=A0AAE3FPU6_9EURY|nr:dihydroneopterin aldolase family protein [Natranaeroarchaeum aerophilus]MCL9812673.1 dihydroneopterin aldolase family protein [Natranaeroarchaeum aerophilus]